MCVYSAKLENMVKEMRLKASLYNKIISIWQDRCRMRFKNHATKDQSLSSNYC